MKHVPKPTTDEDLIKAFLEKGGTIKKGKIWVLAIISGATS